MKQNVSVENMIKVLKKDYNPGLFVKDIKGNVFKILQLTNSLFVMLQDLQTGELVFSSSDYYYL